MKLIHRTAGVFCVLSLIIVILISAVDIAVYGNINYFQKEYRKYHVTESVKMEEKELLFVTKEMMSYLRGTRDDLHINALIEGKKQEFFNEKEIAHMEDVRMLFIGGQWLRRIGVVICIATIIFLIVQKKKELLLKFLRNGMIFFIVTITTLAALISTNFTKYFILFHRIFFSNNLWILNPDTDRLINIVPEGFFIDTSIRIAVLFFVMILSISIVSSILLKIRIKKTGV